MPPPPRRIPRVLSIAGSDSGGGAGIQADLKAFAACGVHGMTAITALTAQNTQEVSAVHPVPGEMILAQVRAVAGDIGVDAVKIGMLGDAATVAAVAAALDELPPGAPVVLDPVMVAESGATLLAAEAREALVAQLLPRATVVTPNLAEAGVLSMTGRESVAQADGIGSLAITIAEHGPGAVLITGGHRDTTTDVLYVPATGSLTEIPGPTYPAGAAHGSGCTHSSVLAARLAWGDDLVSAARTARLLAARAVRDGLRGIGGGAGPVDVLGIGSAERAPLT